MEFNQGVQIMWKLVLILCLHPVFYVKVTNIKTPQTQEDEFIEIQSETGTAFQRWTVRHMTMLQQVCTELLHCTIRTKQ